MCFLLEFHRKDPLSPFLFLIDIKGLNVMMKAMVEAGLFTSYLLGQI
jgi:hypothetical protein